MGRTRSPVANSFGRLCVSLEMENRDRPSGLAQLAKKSPMPVDRGMALCSIPDVDTSPWPTLTYFRGLPRMYAARDNLLPRKDHRPVVVPAWPWRRDAGVYDSAEDEKLYDADRR